MQVCNAILFGSKYLLILENLSKVFQLPDSCMYSMYDDCSGLRTFPKKVLKIFHSHFSIFLIIAAGLFKK